MYELIIISITITIAAIIVIIMLLLLLSLLCAIPANMFLLLTHCLHYRVASFSYVGTGVSDVGPTC